MKPWRREIAHHERNCDAQQADDDDGSAVAAQVTVELELEPNLEHEEDQSDLSEPGENRARRGMEEPVHESREERPEQAGTEQEARKDLTGHVGLTQATNEPGHDACCHQNRDELIQQAERDLLSARPDGRLLTAGRGMNREGEKCRDAESDEDGLPEHRGYRLSRAAAARIEEHRERNRPRLVSVHRGPRRAADRSARTPYCAADA